jgi:uncharacterized membrane-anchored protein YhcB (DUF1043 family)
MPSNFVNSLDTVQPADNAPRVRVNTSVAEAAQSIAGLGSVISGFRDEKILDQALAESSSVLGQVSQYQTDKRQLLLGTSVADKDKLEEFERQLQALRNGEIQGRMSPAAAMLKVRTLTRDYQIRYPHLANQFRELNKQTISGIEDIVTQTEAKDPDVQRQYDLIKNTPPGMTPREYAEQLAAENKLQLSKKQLEASELLGSQREPLMEAVISDYLTSSLINIQSSMLAAYRSGNFITEDELAVLLPLKSNIPAAVDQLILEEQIKSGAKFDDAFRDRMRRSVMDRIDPLIKMAENLDTREKQIRFLELMDKEVRLRGNIQFYKDFGLLARLAEVPGGWEMIGELMKFGDLLKVGLPTLEKLAETDTKTAFLLDMYKSGQLPKWVSERIKDTATGKSPESSGNPQVDKVVSSASWHVLNAPTVPLPQKEDMLSTILATDGGVFTDTYDRILKTPTVQNIIKQSPKLQKALKDKLVRNTVALFNKLSTVDKSLIVLNYDTNKFMVNPEFTLQQEEAMGQIAQASRYGADPTFSSVIVPRVPKGVSELIELINKGLDTLKVSGVDDASVADDFASVLENRPQPIPQKAPAVMTDDEKETLYWETFNQYFDTTNPMRPKLRPGKTKEEAQAALRNLPF